MCINTRQLPRQELNFRKKNLNGTVSRPHGSILLSPMCYMHCSFRVCVLSHASPTRNPYFIGLKMMERVQFMLSNYNVFNHYISLKILSI